MWYTVFPKMEENKNSGSMKILLTKSAEETQQFGELFAKKLNKQSIIALSGDLGAGKTTFVQGLAKGVGITKRIISPTFIIIRKYRIKKQVKEFYHIDLYRIHSEKDLEGLGLQEILHDPEAIVVIEWPEKLGSLLPKERWDICFEHVGENERKITINKIKNST